MTPDTIIHLGRARAAHDQAVARHAAARKACLDAIYDSDAPAPDFHQLLEEVHRERHTLDITTLALRIAEARAQEAK